MVKTYWFFIIKFLNFLFCKQICGRLPFYNRDHDVLFTLILVEEVRFPKSITAEARTLLQGLLHKNPTQRLGGGIDDVKDIQNHPFFACINWTDLVQKRVSDFYLVTLIVLITI